MSSVDVVAGIFLENKKILVAKRHVSKPYAGYWEFPGGKIEPGETESDALIRELQEELNVEILSSQKIFHHHYDYPDKSVNLNFWKILHYKGEITCVEHQELRWVVSEDLFLLPFLEGNKAILKNLLNSLFN